ncbi:MAG: HEAT repeat domain-containing protein [Steroidobacter sp.]
MKFLDDLKAERLIEEIRAASDVQQPKAQQALAKLAKLGISGIPKILETLPVAGKQETLAYVEILTQNLDQKSFALLEQALTDNNVRTNAAISWAMCSSRNFPTSLIFDMLRKPAIPKPIVLEVLNAHRNRLNVRELLSHAYEQENNEKVALFKIIGEIVDESSVTELIARVDGRDTVARTHIINILARFDRPDVSRALQRMLKDPNKLIRQATLNALTKMNTPIEIEPVCQMLSDADIEVQNRAVELVIKAADPNTMRYLVPVLKDENEYARRAAVEVLNSLGTTRDIKQLLQVLKDDDWWVRSRAADALGKIGGPRVVDAVLELIRDDDEEVRRAAIEILNQTKDERAVDQLIAATRDKDWWVAERAVDALGSIGSVKAVPALLELANHTNARALPSIARALGKLGDIRAMDLLSKLLTHPEREVKLEAIAALPKIADDKRVENIRGYIQSVAQGNEDHTVQLAIDHALDELDGRYSTAALDMQRKAEQFAEPSKTLLVDRADIGGIVKTAEATPQTSRLDITTLKPGDVIEGRYKFIEKIGKGAFGTVLLVEDSVVEERLILKFLNANVSQDEEMMKRFVHELRYSRKITHKNVIRIYDFVYMHGNYAISMEYFPSHALSAELSDSKPLPVTLAAQYGCDIATGMAVAHQAGIVHRDLKPANILINDEHFVKVVDFGVAAAHKEGDTQLTKTGYVIGSPKYMAPEQILGKQVDERADIYSLGIILYEMVTGMPPYSRGDHMSVMYQHVQGKAKPPIEVNPNIPKELSDLVFKAMAVDKNKRFQTMDELRTALEKFR